MKAAVISLMLIAAAPPSMAATGDGSTIAQSLAACDARVRRARDAIASYTCYQIVARRNGQFAAVRNHVERFLLREPGHHRMRLLHAGLLADQGQDGAEASFRLAIQGSSDAGDTAAEAGARLMLSTFLMRRGRLDDAGREIDAAGRLVPNADDPLVGLQVTIAQGWLAYRRSDYGRAYSLLQRAHADLPRDAPIDIRSTLYSGLGAVAWATGRVQEAADHYRRQAALLHEAGNLYEEASARINLTLLASVDGQSRAALAREALAIAEAGGNLSVQARAHFYLAETEVASKRLDHAQRALWLSRQMKDASGIQMALRSVAAASLDGDPAAAFSVIQEAIDLAQAAGSRAELTRNWMVRSRMRWTSGPRPEAVADSLALLDAIDVERAQQATGLDRARRVDMWRQPYAEIVARLLSPIAASGSRSAHSVDDLELAFTTMERGRARTLLDTFGSAPAVPQTRLTELRAALGPDEALLEFQIGAATQMPSGVAAASWALVSDANTTRAFALPAANAAGLPEGVRMFNGLVDRRDGAEAAAAQQLYARTLAPALAELPSSVTRIVIVPDHALYEIPFDLLRGPGGDRLGSRYAISIAPSATAWLRWRSRGPAVATSRALALVDPAIASSASSTAADRGSLPDASTLGRLPHARREGAALAEHVAGRHRVLVGPEATEAAIKRGDLRDFGLLHVAAHAIVDDERPERSAVMLAPGSDGEDGRLQPHEIEALDLDGKVIVLSACRSANGAVLRGEGLVGLADAFFRAGAHAVIASLWPLRDDEAALLFERFYQHLGNGENLASALAAARRERADLGAPAAAWAGVVVFGDGGIVLGASDYDGRSRSRLAAVAAALCVLLAIGWLVVTRARPPSMLVR